MAIVDDAEQLQRTEEQLEEEQHRQDEIQDLPQLPLHGVIVAHAVVWRNA